MLRVLDATDGRDRGEAIPDTRACSVAWEPDGSGFAYTRYPAGDQYHRTVHHHVLGTPWADDPVVWAEHPDPQAWPDVTMSPDGALAARARRSSAGRASTSTCSSGPPVAGRRRSPASEVDHGLRFAADGTSLVGVTTLDAPKGRVVRVPLDAPAAAGWTTLVAEGDAVLGAVAVARRRPAGRRRPPGRRHRAAPRRPTGRRSARSTGLGDVVAVAGLSADRDTGDAFVVVDSFGAPTALWRSPAAVRPPAAWIDAGDRRSSVVPTLIVRQVDVPVARRHGDRAVPHPPRRRHAGARRADDPQRLRRVRHRRDAGVVAADRRVVRGRRRCTPSPGCAAASRRARPGTTPAAGPTSRTCSTTSTPAPTGSSPTGSPSRERLAVARPLQRRAARRRRA